MLNEKCHTKPGPQNHKVNCDRSFWGTKQGDITVLTVCHQATWKTKKMVYDPAELTPVPQHAFTQRSTEKRALLKGTEFWGDLLVANCLLLRAGRPQVISVRAINLTLHCTLYAAWRESFNFEVYQLLTWTTVAQLKHLPTQVTFKVAMWQEPIVSRNWAFVAPFCKCQWE